MRRVVTILLILIVGIPVLWEVIAQGTRVWMKYGLMKQPLPSLAPILLPTMPVATATSIVVSVAVSIIMAFLRRSRRGQRLSRRFIPERHRVSLKKAEKTLKTPKVIIYHKGARSLRAGPILPHRSPGRPAVEAEKPKIVEPLKLEEEEEPEEEPEPAPKGPPIPSALPYRGSAQPGALQN